MTTISQTNRKLDDEIENKPFYSFSPYIIIVQQWRNSSREFELITKSFTANFLKNQNLMQPPTQTERSKEILQAQAVACVQKIQSKN